MNDERGSSGRSEGASGGAGGDGVAVYRCLPMGVCSWGFWVSRDGRAVGEVRMRSMTEQGAVVVGSVEYGVVKPSMLKGRWVLTGAGGEAAATAEKVSAWRRRFEIRDEVAGCVYELRYVGWGGGFEWVFGGEAIGWVRNDHFWTRRSRIEMRAEVAEEVVLFGFWLVVLCWRRDSEASSASATIPGG